MILNSNKSMRKELLTHTSDTTNPHNVTPLAIRAPSCQYDYGWEAGFENNLNCWNIPGSYSSANGTLNVPSDTDGWGTVHVLGNIKIDGMADNIIQLFQPWNGDNSRVYFRTCREKIWNNWGLLVTTDYAVNKAGDTMTGDLHIVGYRTHPKLDLYSTLPERKESAWIENEQNNLCFNITNDRYNDVLANRRQIKFFNSHDHHLKNALELIDVVNDVYNISYLLHTSNKPTGTYTGNESTIERTIDTGGIGNICIVYEYGWVATLVTPAGAVSFRTGDSSVTYYIHHIQMKFVNGILTIATDNKQVNTNGVTYYYQVL